MKASPACVVSDVYAPPLRGTGARAIALCPPSHPPTAPSLSLCRGLCRSGGGAERLRQGPVVRERERRRFQPREEPHHLRRGVEDPGDLRRIVLHKRPPEPRRVRRVVVCHGLRRSPGGLPRMGMALGPCPTLPRRSACAPATSVGPGTQAPGHRGLGRGPGALVFRSPPVVCGADGPCLCVGVRRDVAAPQFSRGLVVRTAALKACATAGKRGWTSPWRGSWGLPSVMGGRISRTVGMTNCGCGGFTVGFWCGPAVSRAVLPRAVIRALRSHVEVTRFARRCGGTTRPYRSVRPGSIPGGRHTYRTGSTQQQSSGHSARRNGNRRRRCRGPVPEEVTDLCTAAPMAVGTQQRWCSGNMQPCGQCTVGSIPSRFCLSVLAPQPHEGFPGRPWKQCTRG